MKQLVRANIFDTEDKADLVGESYIVKMAFALGMGKKYKKINVTHLI